MCLVPGGNTWSWYHLSSGETSTVEAESGSQSFFPLPSRGYVRDLTDQFLVDPIQQVSFASVKTPKILSALQKCAPFDHK